MEGVVKRWMKRLAGMDALVHARLEVLETWDQDLAPRMLEEVANCAEKHLPGSPRPILSLTRRIRELGDPYLAASVLIVIAQRRKDTALSDFLKARAALYLCAYGLFEEAYHAVEPYLHAPEAPLPARVFAARVAALYHQYHHNWEEALAWNRKEEQLIREGEDDPDMAFRFPVVFLNRVHILLHRFRTRSLNGGDLPDGQENLQELMRSLRVFHAYRARYPDFYNFAWSVLAETYLHTGFPERTRRLVRYVLARQDRFSPELVAAMHFYRAVADFQEGRPGSLEALRKALRLAMESGAFFRERDILYTALMLLRRLPRSEGTALAQYEELFRALLKLLAEKDLYTAADHSLRVSWIAYWIGRVLTEEDPAFRREVFPRSLAIAGLVHDIGKLFLPWVLLNRFRRFTDAEWKLIREHVRYGVEALQILGMPGVARVVAEHHERLDGSGYPRGLTRKELSMMGAVLAAADTFEAATSPNRHYRPPKTPEAVLEEMYGQHHPRVLKALEELVQRGDLLRQAPSLPTWLEMIRRGV